MLVGAEQAQLAGEFVDQPQAGLDCCFPLLQQPEPGELLAAADPEEIGDRTGLAVREQHRLDALNESVHAGGCTSSATTRA